MTRRYPWKAILHLALGVVSLLMLVPFLWMLSTSLKSINEVFTFPPALLGRTIRWDNYLRVFDRFPFGLFFANSVKISFLVVIGQLVTSSMAGFVFARLRFRFRETIFALYLATMIVPFHVTLVPTYIIMRYLGLIDNHASLILSNLATAFGTFLMRQFFMTIPADLEDAAKLDGCTPFDVYWRIFLPLSKPALASLGIFILVATWNDFIRPLIFLNTLNKMTLPLGLANMQGLYATDWPMVMAGTFISIFPLLIAFLAAQDFFVKGVTLTGLKE